MNFICSEAANLKTCYNAQFGILNKDERRAANDQFFLACGRVAAISLGTLAAFGALISVAVSPYAPMLLIATLFFAAAGGLSHDLYHVARNGQERNGLHKARALGNETVFGVSAEASLWKDLTKGTFVLKHIPLG